MAHKDWRPRLSIEINEEQFNKLQRLIPWGVKNQIFKVIIDDLIKALEKDSQLVIGAFLSRRLGLTDILSKGKEKNGGKDVSD